MLTPVQQALVEKINRSFSIVDHVGDDNLAKSGRYYMGKCPFCGGRDRFQIKTGQAGGQLWICRKCAPNKYHDAIFFLMKANGATFGEVLDQFGGSPVAAVPKITRGALYRPSPLKAPPQAAELVQPVPTAEPPADNWQSEAWAAVGRCADNLQREYKAGAAVAQWLEGRGITADLAADYGIGFNPHWLPTAGGKIAPGVTIPCFNNSGLWYVKTRLTKQARAKIGAKYLLLQGSNPHALFNADKLPTAAAVLLVEGEFDAILAQRYAPHGAAVTTFGAATMTLESSPAWGNFLVGKRAVLAAMDNDGAGNRAVSEWLKWPFIGRALPLPVGKDATELWQAEGGAAVATWLEGMFGAAVPNSQP